MNIKVNIERLVLDGIDLKPGDDRRLKQSVIHELTGLLTDNVIGCSLGHATKQQSHGGSSIGRIADIGSLGLQVANAIHTSLPGHPVASSNCHEGEA